MTDQNAPSRFARFLGKGGIAGAPTDASAEPVQKRPAGGAIRRLGLVGLAAIALTVTPSDYTDKAHANVPPTVSAVEPVQASPEQPKSRVQEHLERGVEMTWWRSSSTPSTVVLYLDRNRGSFAVERHGGIDQPEEAKGALPFPMYMQASQIEVQQGIRNAVMFSLPLLTKVPGFNEAKAGDGTGLGDMKSDLEQLIGVRPIDNPRLLNIAQKAGNLLQNTLVLAEHHELEFNKDQADIATKSVKHSQVSALLMDMAINVYSQTEAMDTARSQEFLRQLLTPPTPEEKDRGIMVSSPAPKHQVPSPVRSRTI